MSPNPHDWSVLKEKVVTSTHAYATQGSYAWACHNYLSQYATLMTCNGSIILPAHDFVLLTVLYPSMQSQK